MRSPASAARSALVLLGQGIALGCASTGAGQPVDPGGMGVDPEAARALQVDEAWAVGDAVEYQVLLERPGRARELSVEVELEEVRPWALDTPLLHGSYWCQADEEWVTLRMLSTPATLTIGVREGGKVVCRERAEIDSLHGLADQASPSDCAGSWFGDLFALALEVDCLEDLLFEVADRPSLGSILANNGKAIVAVRGLPYGSFEFEDLDTALGVLPTVRMEGRIEANRKTALEFRVWITYLRPPLAVTSGVVRLEAWKPSDPEVRVSASLSGARRGSGLVEVSAEEYARLARGRVGDRADAEAARTSLPPAPSDD